MVALVLGAAAGEPDVRTLTRCELQPDAHVTTGVFRTPEALHARLDAVCGGLPADGTIDWTSSS